MSRMTTKWLALCLVAMAGLALVRPAFATELTTAKYIQDIKMYGDYRIRYDSINFRSPASGATAPAPDKNRFRQRLRLGIDFTLPYQLKVLTRFASGTGEQTSTNQTLTNEGTQKAVWIDRAYLQWKPVDLFQMEVGKMANPLWTLYSSDALWDSDYNPEGAGENLSYLVGEKTNIFFNALQGVVNSYSNPSLDQYLLTEQLGAEIQLPFETRFKVGFAYHDWIHVATQTVQNTAPSGSNAGQVAPMGKKQEGNTYSNNSLANDFGVSEISAEFGAWAGKIPLSFQGTFIKNNRVKSQYKNRDTGYQVGTIVGKAKEAKSWEVAYFYKYLEADATIADLADSDFGDGGTNRYGNIGWVAYNPVEFMTVQAKYLATKNIAQINSYRGDMNRLQLDLMVRF